LFLPRVSRARNDDWWGWEATVVLILGPARIFYLFYFYFILSYTNHPSLAFNVREVGIGGDERPKWGLSPPYKNLRPVLNLGPT
jgi:hypothetical protein